MVQKKKSKWDGKSRVSTDLYRKNFEEIFMGFLTNSAAEVRLEGIKNANKLA